jgi:hypothetical protein
MGCIAYNLSFWQGIAWLVSLHLHFANVSQMQTSVRGVEDGAVLHCGPDRHRRQRLDCIGSGYCAVLEARAARSAPQHQLTSCLKISHTTAMLGRLQGAHLYRPVRTDRASCLTRSWHWCV